MTWLKGGVRFLLVTVGVIALTSLGIDATQYFEGSGSALSLLTEEVLEDECPTGMAPIVGANPTVCIDAYEASVGEDCSVSEARSLTDTATISNESDCRAESLPEVDPWVFISHNQAMNMCARSGKRLPTSEEWYLAALGTPDNEQVCNIAGNKSQTGDYGACVSGSGAFDMIGNVWEWVDAEITDGFLEGEVLPEEGFVETTNPAGIARTTTSTPQILFNEDYFWSKPDGDYRMIRGGFYGSREDAGLYAVHADIEPNFTGQAVGFRCVKDI